MSNSTSHNKHSFPHFILQCPVILAMFSGQTYAAVLISDNFNTPDGKLGVNANLDTRQAGTLKEGSGLNWVAPRVDFNITGNQVRSNLRVNAEETAGRVYFDHNFTDASINTAGGFTVEYDFIPGASATTWLALGLGATTAQLGGTDANLANIYDFGFFLRANGQFFVYKDQGGSASVLDTAIISPVEGSSYRVSMTVLTQNFNLNTLATVSVTVDGNIIDLNGAGTAGTTTTFTWDADVANYIAWESNQTINSFDNVSIATVVPEPRVALLGAAAGMLLLTKRSRRTGATA